MNSIEAPFFHFVTRETPLDTISVLLDQLEKQPIDKIPWPAYDYKPEARFVIAHASDSLFVKFYVAENVVKANCRHTNEPVYKDSCVELFISFGNDKQYYNFEFNCIGTCLCGFGANKQERQLLSQQVIEKIRRQTLIKRDPESRASSVYWELTIAIPVQTFCFHSLSCLRDQQCQVNLYKCGDDLPQPHYLSWTDIISEEPNFHLSEFFGTMRFA